MSNLCLCASVRRCVIMLRSTSGCVRKCIHADVLSGVRAGGCA